MRWLGAAQRAHDARRRTAFGRPLGEHEGVGFMLADNAMDIHHSRLVICPRTAGPLGPFRGSEAIWRVVDRSMQILGGLGITDDTIVARLFRDIRPSASMTLFPAVGSWQNRRIRADAMA